MSSWSMGAISKCSRIQIVCEIGASETSNLHMATILKIRVGTYSSTSNTFHIMIHKRSMEISNVYWLFFFPFQKDFLFSATKFSICFFSDITVLAYSCLGVENNCVTQSWRTNLIFIIFSLGCPASLFSTINNSIVTMTSWLRFLRLRWRP